LDKSTDYNVNAKMKKPLPTWLPFVVGALLVAQFAGLGAWQISRGLEKRAEQQLFRDESGFTTWRDGMDIRPYQRLKATGSYDADRQVLLENIIVNSRYGYYVITPLVGLDDEPVLLINRGWIEKTSEPLDTASLDVPPGRITVRGRAGSLPRAGVKMGEAFRPGQDWPKAAVYPSPEEVAAALGTEVQPFVLLMDHEEEHGFFRHWVPTEFGPGKHFGYALQWFAMGAVLSGLLAWNYRKKRFK
jgi:surfeit locus 1 family protein